MWCFLRANVRKKHHMYSHTPEFPNEQNYIQQSAFERMFLCEHAAPA